MNGGGGGVDSFRLTYSSGCSQVSVRDNKSISFLSETSSLTKIAFGDNDLMFKRPHLQVFVSWVVAEVVLICIRFLYGVLPLLIFDLNHLMGWWTDTISMGLWLCDRSRGSAEKCSALQLCFLVPTLGCHVIDLVIFLDKRDAPSQVGWTPSPLTRPGFLQKVCQLSTKPTPFTGHHLDSQRLKDNMRLNMSPPDVLGRGPEKTTVSDIVFSKAHTDSTLTLGTASWG